MIPELQIGFISTNLVFAGARPINQKIGNVASSVSPSSESSQRRALQEPIIQGRAPTRISREIAEASGSEERIFDALVRLKVAVSQYAMHMPSDARGQLFDKLDEILHIENWYDEDELPSGTSFSDFLKWSIYIRKFDWESIGISDEGNLLLSIRSAKGLLTANFLGNGQVRWTANIQSESGVELAAGKSSLKYFADQANFYLN